MINFTAILNELDKVKKLPWKGILVIIASSFVLATALSIALEFLFFPQLKSFKQLGKEHPYKLKKIQSPSLNSSDLDKIVARNIFNKEGETGEEKEIESIEVKRYTGDEAIKSTLPLKLMGTIYGGDPYSGLALIENSSKKTLNSFFVGNLLMADATIVEIHREKIIIDRGDHKEFLELEKKERTSRRKKSKGKKSRSHKPSFATTAPPDNYKEEGFERTGNSIMMSSDFRKKLLTGDFAKVLQDAKAEPHFVAGELGGFKLTRIRKDSIYEKSGLRNGDIIKEINGVSLVDTAQAIKLLNSLRGENELDVRLERGGSAFNINLQIR